MATKPGTTPTTPRTPRFNETAIAIGGSLLIAIVLSSLFVANPFRAARLAYTDYSNTPAAGAPKAQTERAGGPVQGSAPGTVIAK